MRFNVKVYCIYKEQNLLTEFSLVQVHSGSDVALYTGLQLHKWNGV